MNLVTLSSAQIDFLKSTLQKQQSDFLADLNMGNLSDASADLLNDRYDLIRDIIKELEDCNTPKVIKAPTSQQITGTAWEGTTATAKVAKVAPKTLYNLKANGKLRKNHHWRKEGKTIVWNASTVSQYFSENSH